jgi:DNA replication and repair protein RecF
MSDPEGEEGAVWLKSLSLRSFRNYASLDIQLDRGLTVIVGANGQGKTNLIEAAYFLCLARSFREHRHSRIVRFDDDVAVVGGDVAWQGRDRSLRLTLPRRGPKKAEVDGGKLQRLSELIGLVPVVSLTPEDGLLAGGEPGARRRFMDVVLAQTDRGYLEALSQYRRALMQRNASLRTGHRDVVASYEAALVSSGARLRVGRKELALFLNEHAAEVYTRISGSGERFGVSLRSNPREGPGETGEAGEGLAEALRARREADLERGFTTVGPHRDDLQLTVGGRSLQIYGSHGEVRTSLAALKLAELEYIRSRYGRQPLLLMDEVASVLDRVRADELAGLLLDHASQIMVTSPREEDLGPLASGDHRLVLVEGGGAEVR